MSMFKTLSRFTEGSTVHVAIFAAGEGRLRAIISQKPDDADSDKKPLSLAVTGTPEELDTELPLALAESVAAPAKSVTDQVKEQQAEAATEANDKPDTGKLAAKTAAKASTKAAPKTPVKKPVKTPVKKAEKPAPAAAPVIQPLYPEKPKAAAPKKATKSADRQEAKRAACLADLNDALAKHGDNLTRRLFAAEAKTGRSFETVFGSWEKFLDARATEANQKAIEAQQATQSEAVTAAGSNDPASLQSTPAADLDALQQQVAASTAATAVAVSEVLQEAGAPATGTKSSHQPDLIGGIPPATNSHLQIF